MDGPFNNRVEESHFFVAPSNPDYSRTLQFATGAEWRGCRASASAGREALKLWFEASRQGKERSKSERERAADGSAAKPAEWWRGGEPLFGRDGGCGEAWGVLV